jgi:RNA polymerase sigma-70 factor (ECF subfamily)
VRAKSTYNGVTDEKVMKAFQEGDASAFDVLVERFRDPLTNYVFRFLGNMDESVDVVQEAFVRLFRKKHMYEPIAKFSTWLYTIAGNLARSELRRRSRASTVSLNNRDDGDGGERDWDIADETYVPDKNVDTVLVQQYVQEALLKIPPVYRECVVLRDIQDLEYEEISKITGLALGTVKSRINRGRQRLQELLKDVYAQRMH